MIIETQARTATRNIGTRVVATSEDNHREVELWDYNATEEINHLRAAKLIAKEGELAHIATGDGFRLYRWYEPTH